MRFSYEAPHYYQTFSQIIFNRGHFGNNCQGIHCLNFHQYAFLGFLGLFILAAVQ